MNTENETPHPDPLPIAERELKQLPGWGRARLPVELVARKMLVGAELGVQKGEYSEQLLGAGVYYLVLVDLWARQENYFDIANVADGEQQKNLRETLQRLEKFPCRTQVLIGKSADRASKILDGALDFVYIDADHKYASVKADLEAWYPKVKLGGIVSGHDFMDSPNCCGSEFGVATAVQEFCKKIGVTELFVAEGECFPNWHFVKPGTPVEPTV